MSISNSSCILADAHSFPILTIRFLSAPRVSGLTPPTMNLQFISVGQGRSSGKGGYERRLIRSHVMKGRNSGKSHPSAQKLVPAKRTLVRYDCLGCSEARVARRVHTCACYQQTLDMRQLIFDDLALVSVPYQLDRRLRGLLHECQSLKQQ